MSLNFSIEYGFEARTSLFHFLHLHCGFFQGVKGADVKNLSVSTSGIYLGIQGASSLCR